jgi:MFS transporter, AAHS family, 4-hydroxybenzoate transporter
MIPQWGWRSVLILGGVVPLTLAVVLLLLLPESVRYLVAENRPVERIRRVLRRISPAIAEATSFTMAEKVAVQAKSSMGVVLSRRYLVGTVMLWLAYFMGLVIFYALINWMPVLFRDAGLSAQTAALVSALFPLGGVGAVLSGWLMDRFNPNRVVAVCFALTAVAIYAVGHSTGTLGLLMAIVLLSGTLMNTAQTSLPSLAAGFYPTHGRATGVAWMMAMGRFGGIAGSFLVAELSRRELGFGQVFTVMAVPALIAAGALVAKQIAHPEGNTRYAVGKGEVLGH